MGKIPVAYLRGALGISPLLSALFFQFHAVFGEKWPGWWVCTPTFGVGSPLWKILDPPIKPSLNIGNSVKIEVE